MIMCVLLCYSISIHMSQLLSTGRRISSYIPTRKSGHSLDSAPLHYHSCRNFLVYAIIEKWINFFFKYATDVKDGQRKIPILT